MGTQISPDAQAVLQQAGEGAQQYVLSKGGYGNNLTSGEATSLLSGFTPQLNVGQTVQSGIAALGSQQYQFNSQDYLPGIQNTANSIYSPQALQLQAIRELQSASYQDTKIQTEKDFAKRLQQEVESVNRRGAFFSGGAIQNEQDIRSQQASTQKQQSLQFAAADYSNLASQAQLQAEKADYIQQRLTGAENSAYSRWSDNRSFSLSTLQAQYQVYSNERDFARNVFESDRSASLQEKQLDMEQKQFQQTYKINEEQFKQAKEQFNLDMKVKNLSYSQALDSFKSNYAVDNSGIFGIDQNGNDNEQQIYSSYQNSSQPIGQNTDQSIIYSNDFQFGF